MPDTSFNFLRKLSNPSTVTVPAAQNLVIIFPIFLYETLRKIGISEGIAGWLLGLGFLVVYAAVMEF